MPDPHVHNHGSPHTPPPGGTTGPAHVGHLVAGANVGKHGCILFGGEKIFLSHIPMSTGMHAHQIIFEVTLAHPQIRRGRAFSNELFTFDPADFSLDSLQLGVITELQGRLVRGNFEGTHSTLFENVTAKVKKLNVQRSLTDPDATPAKLTYMVFGTPRETFLVHKIGGNKAAFDQVLRVKLSPPLTSAELAKGVELTVPDRANEVARRIQGPADGEVSATVKIGDVERAIKLRVDPELSILIGPNYTPPR